MANAAYNNNMEASGYRGLMGLLRPAHEGSQSAAPAKENEGHVSGLGKRDSFNHMFDQGGVYGEDPQ